jgi:Methylamine utilisation protein MauE
VGGDGARTPHRTGACLSQRGGVPKLLAPADFALAVRNYRLLRPAIGERVAKWLPRLELVIAFALLLGIATKAAAGLAAAALVGFAAAVAVNLLRGRRIDCGCYSTASPRTIGWGLVLRDVLLAAAAVFVFVAPAETLTLAPIGSDGSTALALGDAMGVVVIAASLVLLELLVREALRVRRAGLQLSAVLAVQR